MSSLDDLRWQAVQSRQNGSAFLFGVVTTGIVCRPGCKSRTPRRENVRYFEWLQDAVQAGFRPCLRCRPFAATDAASQPIAQAMRYLQTHLEETVDLAALAAEVGLSASHLQRRFAELVGVSPRAFTERLRALKMGDALQDGDSATDAAYAAGFSSSSRAHAGAARHLAMTPTEVRRGGNWMTLRYATAPCQLGRLLVATTTKGICSIALGDTDEDLLKDLQQRFPKAKLDAADDDMTREVQAALQLIDRGHPLRLPLDLKATAFQMRVWAELQRTPAGKTRTYAQVATALGQPTAARAVAKACATNPVAVEVPCHRVVGANGALTGYRWGVHRKRSLLKRESKASDKG